MIKGALGRYMTVDMRMQKEQARTVASSKVFDDCTTRREVVRRSAAWPMANGGAEGGGGGGDDCGDGGGSGGGDGGGTGDGGDEGVGEGRATGGRVRVGMVEVGLGQGGQKVN